MQEKYFVVCDGVGYPQQIYFTKEDAFGSRSEYIDVFDENGVKVCVYQLVDGQYINY